MLYHAHINGEIYDWCNRTLGTHGLSWTYSIKTTDGFDHATGFYFVEAKHKTLFDLQWGSHVLLFDSETECLDRAYEAWVYMSVRGMR